VGVVLPQLTPIPEAVLVLAAFGLVYFAIAAVTGVPEARALVRRIAP
jgi:hypothetical protein